MPVRVLIAVLGAVLVIAVGAILLLPRDEVDPAPETTAAPVATVGADATATPGVPPSGGAPAPAATEPAVDPALAADLVALADRERVAAPDPDAAELVDVVATGNLIEFTFRAGINGGEYDLVATRDVILPGLEAFTCDDGACFEVMPVAVEAACAEPELAAVLQRGALIRYRYLDTADEVLGDVTFGAANCVT